MGERMRYNIEIAQLKSRFLSYSKVTLILSFPFSLVNSFVSKPSLAAYPSWTRGIAPTKFMIINRCTRAASSSADSSSVEREGLKADEFGSGIEYNRGLFDFDCNFFHADMIGELDHHMNTAVANGVHAFICPGSSLVDSVQAMDLAEKFPTTVYATVGLHPYNTCSIDEDSLTLFRQLTSDPRCLAVGECGLDYSEGFPAASIQIPWFRLQVERAIEIDKPLYLHSRDAIVDFIGILESYGFARNKPPPIDAVIHCFTGSIEDLTTFLDFGFSIGLTGFVFKLSDAQLAEWLQLITLDRLVIETDAPYMGFKGCRSTEASKKNQKYPNTPSSLVKIANHVALVGGWTFHDVAKATAINSYRFLRKV